MVPPTLSPLAVSGFRQTSWATGKLYTYQKDGDNAVLTRIIGIELCLPPCGVGHAAHRTEVSWPEPNTIPAPAPKVATEQAPCPEFSDAKCRRFRVRPSRAADARGQRALADGEYSEFLICKVDGPETGVSGCLFGSKEAQLW